MGEKGSWNEPREDVCAIMALTRASLTADTAKGLGAREELLLLASEVVVVLPGSSICMAFVKGEGNSMEFSVTVRGSTGVSSS